MNSTIELTERPEEALSELEVHFVSFVKKCTGDF